MILSGLKNVIIEDEIDKKEYQMIKRTLFIPVLVLLTLFCGMFAREKPELTLEEQLKAAIDMAENAKRKSPWHCIRIVEVYLKMEKVEEAFTWMDKAVERGFLSYQELDKEKFALLRKDKRFAGIVSRIKEPRFAVRRRCLISIA